MAAPHVSDPAVAHSPVMARLRSALTLFACLAALPRTAAADDIATEEEICRYRKEGEACTIGNKPGTCRAATCSRIDYSSGKPQAAERPCQQCVPDDAPVAAPPTSSTPTASAAKAADPKAPATPSADAKAPAAAAPAKSGCSVDAPTPTSPLLLLVLLLGRRRGATVRPCGSRPQR